MYEDFDFEDCYEITVGEVFNDFIDKAKEFMKEDIKKNMDSLEGYYDRQKKAANKILELTRENSELKDTIVNLEKEIDILENGRIQAKTKDDTLYCITHETKCVCRNPNYAPDDIIELIVSDGTPVREMKAKDAFGTSFIYYYYAKISNRKLVSIKLDDKQGLAILDSADGTIEIIKDEDDYMPKCNLYTSIEEAKKHFSEEYKRFPEKVWSDELTEKYCK